MSIILSFSIILLFVFERLFVVSSSGGGGGFRWEKNSNNYRYKTSNCFEVQLERFKLSISFRDINALGRTKYDSSSK